MEYFISVNNDKRGPYSLEELKARGITSETLVQAEGSSQWVPAWQIEELRTILLSAQQPEQPIVEPVGSESQSEKLDDFAEVKPSQNEGNTFKSNTYNQNENYQAGQPVYPPQTPRKEKSGGGCLSKILITLIILAAIVGLAVATCPDENAHKTVLTDVVASAISDEASGKDSTFNDNGVVSKLFRQMSDSWTKEVVTAAVNNILHVDNHIVYSVGKVRLAGKEHTVSVGVFGHVFTIDKDDLRQAAEKYYDKAEQDVKTNLQKKAEQIFNESVVDPAEQAFKDVAKQVEEEVKRQMGGDNWPFGDDGSDGANSDSTANTGI